MSEGATPCPKRVYRVEGSVGVVRPCGRPLWPEDLFCPDCHTPTETDRLCRVIHKFRRIPKGKKFQRVKKRLITILEKFNYRWYWAAPGRGLWKASQIGEQEILDVPNNQRGHLKVFQGKRIHMVVMSTGRYGRGYYVSEYIPRG